ncbi:hypothetical protein D3C87_1112310 [compost metagenome]
MICLDNFKDISEFCSIKECYLLSLTCKDLYNVVRSRLNPIKDNCKGIFIAIKHDLAECIDIIMNEYVVDDNSKALFLNSAIGKKCMIPIIRKCNDTIIHNTIQRLFNGKGKFTSLIQYLNDIQFKVDATKFKDKSIKHLVCIDEIDITKRCLGGCDSSETLMKYV